MSSRTASSFCSRSNRRRAANRDRLLVVSDPERASSSSSLWITSPAPFALSFGATAMSRSARRDSSAAKPAGVRRRLRQRQAHCPLKPLFRLAGSACRRQAWTETPGQKRVPSAAAAGAASAGFALAPGRRATRQKARSRTAWRRRERRLPPRRTAPAAPSAPGRRCVHKPRPAPRRQMETQLVDDLFELIGAGGGRLPGQLPPGAKGGAGPGSAPAWR